MFLFTADIDVDPAPLQSLGRNLRQSRKQHKDNDQKETGKEPGARSQAATEHQRQETRDRGQRMIPSIDEIKTRGPRGGAHLQSGLSCGCDERG